MAETTAELDEKTLYDYSRNKYIKNK